MILFKTINDFKKYITKVQPHSGSIGFVPTMGALHNGHLSLIKTSKKVSGLTVCSIFINPTQFNDPSDYQLYPVTIDQDIRLLEREGCDILFLPPVNEIYPPGYEKKHVELGALEHLLEGKYRPGHFQGVCQVVDQLLSIVEPDQLFLGQKDYQQCMVITELIRQTGKKIRLQMVPTMRETSGLAMSSRNLRLSETDRIKAAAIYRTLQWISSSIQPGPVTDIISKAESLLMNAGFDKVDYISIAAANNLEPVTFWDGKTSLVVLAAAFLSGIRLIDNISLTTD
ncbi:MAG: pantoate--beta-alanine ligase [Bacteroidota bacterium]